MAGSVFADNRAMVIPMRILTLTLGAMLIGSAAMTLLLLAAR
jgi:hypothetical protein